MFASMLGFILTFVFIFIFMIAIVAGITQSFSSDKEVTLDKKSVLHLTLDFPIKEITSDNPFEMIDFNSMEAKVNMSLFDINRNIEKAAKDKNIKGIFLDLDMLDAGFSSVYEIREALKEFKKSGKFIVAYSEIYTIGAYYLASVADEVYLVNEGYMDFKGLQLTQLFFKGTLEKLGIEAQPIRHGKYKSAIEPFINDKMSEANKTQLTSILMSLNNSILKDISESRKISVEQLNIIADSFLIRSPKDALSKKLIDKIAYKDDVINIIVNKCGAKNIEDIDLINLRKYNNVPNKDKKYSKDKIAVIFAEGEIVDRYSKGEGIINSAKLSKLIQDARLDNNIKAIVLRVNSPGGSVIASDVIWREMILAKKAKPVIVSMGNYAASGGYYIACMADTIVASPTTITGSIGVFGLYFNFKKLLNDKLGITTEAVKSNKFADLGIPDKPLSESHKLIIQNRLDDIYNGFITKVSEGRKLSINHVDSIAQGRVWTGREAKEIGLVDIVGGLNKAIEIAAKKANVKD
ncbi:MAG TPA: signal peptide peptidase SppA, partial [Clostridiales bacterium]|nr:signal peptide peptidase SppA [Clostridiales bacterium]